MNKKFAALTLVVGAFLMITGCDKTEPTPAEPQTYTAYGRYHNDIDLTDDAFTEGFITNDGNMWEYDVDTISDQVPYNNMPIWAGFSDNGTPDDITDDIPLGLVYDRNTAIYDDLEEALSEGFEIERTNNNIRIGGRK